MKLMMGKTEMVMGSKYLTELKDSSDILSNPALQRQRMEEDGYLYIRGFHELEPVLNARREMLESLRDKGMLDPDQLWEEGYIGLENKSLSFHNQATEYPEFLKLVNSERVLGFFEQLLGEQCLTFDTKWFRAIQQGGNSGAHYDIVYMGKGTKNVYTVWTPLGDIPLEMGGLAVCLGSHQFEKVKKTYGSADYEKVSGWFSENPVDIVHQFGGQWATAHFKLGDAIIFGMYTMHASFNNETNRYRISSDTRYQRSSEPVDPRWHGPKTAVAKNEDEVQSVITMEEARREWGI